VSITAIEIEAKVTVSIKLIKPGDPMYVLPSPTTVGTTSIKDYSPTAFVSFHGFGDKPLPIEAFVDEVDTPWPIQQHLTFGAAVADMDFVADNMQVASRNALLKCITFLHEVLGYSFSQVRTDGCPMPGSRGAVRGAGAEGVAREQRPERRPTFPRPTPPPPPPPPPPPRSI